MIPVIAEGAGGFAGLTPLPRAISGQFAGTSHGALIVVGGSSFDAPPWDGGIKKWDDRILVLPKGETTWRESKLDAPLAYGASVSWRDALYIAGGSDGKTHTARARRIEWKGGKAVVTELPKLPVGVANCAGALIGSTMYVFGGQEGPETTPALNRLFALDLAHVDAGWKTLAPLPAEGRILPVMAAVGDALYVFSGAALEPARRYLKDGWRWSKAEGWKRVADAPAYMVAAPALASSATTLVVCSGDDGALAGRLAEFKEKHPGFMKQVRIFDTLKNAWREAGTLPVSLVTTTAVEWNGQLVIPGGEDRPGHRSAQVLGSSMSSLR